MCSHLLILTHSYTYYILHTTSYTFTPYSSRTPIRITHRRGCLIRAPHVTWLPTENGYRTIILVQAKSDLEMARVPNPQNRQDSHSATKRISNHLRPSLACTVPKEETHLHRHTSQRWIQDDTSELSWKITKGNLQIGDGLKYNNIYLVIVINQEGSLNVAELSSTYLWHKGRTTRTLSKTHTTRANSLAKVVFSTQVQEITWSGASTITIYESIN